MRNIFLFIKRYFTFLTFLVLQGVAIWFLVTYNKFHRAKGLGVANEVTGWFNSRFNTMEDFFAMRDENRRVHRMNDSLMNLLSSNFAKEDTTTRVVVDSILQDTSGFYRRYLLRDAIVTYGTVNQEKNYIHINKGSRHGIKDDMGVFSSNGGLVGKVVNVSTNYSAVMSLLHVQNKADALVKKTKSSGTLSWDAKDPRFLMLSGIPKSDSVLKGDTIITGTYSLSIPPGKLIGTVEEVIAERATNFAVLKVRTTANFQDLQQVFVVEDLYYNEQAKLLEDTRKKVK